MVHPDVDRLHRKVSEKAPTSAALHNTTSELLPDPSCGTLNMLHPIYIRSARGSRVVDVDGNEYIDLVMGYGPQVLGHAPEVAIEVLEQVARRGMQFAMHGPYQEPLARLIADAAPGNEMVLFCNSGTEATMHAMRVARAFSHKDTIALFSGGYHGAHDYVMVEVDPGSPPEALRMVPRCPGIPQSTLSTMTMLPYWNDLAFDMIRSMKDQLAAVLIEPVQGPSPQTGQGEWLHALRRVCTECSVVLIFDEVITGFRLGYGGAQQMFGISADLVTYGKVIGGGLPCGAVVGRSDIMGLYAPHHPTGPVVSAAGTYSGNPMSMATGTAVLSHLRSHPEIYSYLHEQGQRFSNELNKFFAANGLGAEVWHADSILSLRIRSNSETPGTRDAAVEQAWSIAGDAVQLKLLDRGVIVPGAHQFYLSSAHTEADVDELILAFGQAVLEARNEGFFPEKQKAGQHEG